MDKKVFVSAAVMFVSSVAYAEALPEGLSSIGTNPLTSPTYANGQSTFAEDLEYLRKATAELESAKTSLAQTEARQNIQSQQRAQLRAAIAAEEAAQSSPPNAAEPVGLTDAELQEQYFNELYGQVKEKGALRRVDQKALLLAKEYEKAKFAPDPALNANGAVTYTFGATIPKILCRPLRVTDIQLQPGETVTDAPAIGDSVNWALTPATSGSGDTLTVHILVKPTMPDLVTNLIVHTDRRTYVLELVSDKKNHTPLVAFNYPDWDKREDWDAFMSKLKNKTAYSVRNAQQSRGKGAVVLNENYTVTGKRYPWFPVEVVDDGLKTYITFPDTVAATEFPVFMVVKGKKMKDKEVVNYRVQGQTMIIDRIFKHGILRIGTGAAAETVTITRTSYKAEKVAEDEREFDKRNSSGN